MRLADCFPHGPRRAWWVNKLAIGVITRHKRSLPCPTQCFNQVVNNPLDIICDRLHFIC